MIGLEWWRSADGVEARTGTKNGRFRVGRVRLNAAASTAARRLESSCWSRFDSSSAIRFGRAPAVGCLTLKRRGCVYTRKMLLLTFSSGLFAGLKSWRTERTRWSAIRTGGDCISSWPKQMKITIGKSRKAMLRTEQNHDQNSELRITKNNNFLWLKIQDTEQPQQANWII